MKFGLDKPVRIVMIGAGGTGGHTVPHLYRLLHTLDRPVEVILVDGDMVEKKNLVRQNFIASDLGKNKRRPLRSGTQPRLGWRYSTSRNLLRAAKSCRNC